MAQIVDTNGNAIHSEILREQQTAHLAHLRNEFSNHPSRGLTPQKLAGILRDGEQGNLIRQAELGEDMEEKDAHIFAELSKRKRALLTLDWTIEPPRNASAEEKKAADFVKDVLDDIPDFEDVLLNLLDGIGKGYSCQEIAWQQLGKKAWIPKCIDHRSPTWFQVNPDSQNELRLRDNTALGAELYAFGWVKHVHRAKSGYIGRAGLHRVLAWPYLFKNYATQDFAEFLEIYGLPLRLGTYPAGTGDKEKMDLLRAVVNIGHDAAGIIPEGMLIEFKEATKGSDVPFQAMFDFCERLQSKAILGGTLTTQADGKSSTNALGNVHNEVRHDLLVSDARQAAGTLTRDLIFPIVSLNLGGIDDPRRAPRIVFDTRELADFATFAEAVPNLVNVGLEITADYVYEKLRIPKPAQGDKILKPKAPAAPEPHGPGEVPVQKTRTAAQRAVIAALRSSGTQAEAGQFKDQLAIDAGLDKLPGEAIDLAMAKMLEPVIEVLRAGGTPDEAADKLAELWPNMDARDLQELVARALFVADVWGRLTAGDDVG